MGRDVFGEPSYSAELRETWRAELAIYRSCLQCGRYGVASDLGLVDTWLEGPPEWLEKALEAWRARLAAEDRCEDPELAAWYMRIDMSQRRGA